MNTELPHTLILLVFTEKNEIVLKEYDILFDKTGVCLYT